jgi:hypothetical protein
MGRISEFTDVMSGLIVSSALLPLSIGEESMAEGQLKIVVEKMKHQLYVLQFSLCHLGNKKFS